MNANEYNSFIPNKTESSIMRNDKAIVLKLIRSRQKGENRSRILNKRE